MSSITFLYAHQGPKPPVARVRSMAATRRASLSKALRRAEFAPSRRRLRALGQPPLALPALNTTGPLPGGQTKPILRNVRRTQPLRFALGMHWLLEWGCF